MSLAKEFFNTLVSGVRRNDSREGELHVVSRQVSSHEMGRVPIEMELHR